MSRQTIYFDHNATTALCPEARQAMLPFFEGEFGNPSSYHHLGRKARASLQASRYGLADIFNCGPGEVVFTSGGTEANNMALRGAAAALRRRGRHIIVSAIEHHSVLKTAEALAASGYDVTFAPVDDQGVVDPQRVAAATRPDTILISVMSANNETGALQPVHELGKLSRRQGIVFHTDAVQAFGKIDLGTVFEWADLVTLASHKIYGPAGAGALLVRNGTPLASVITGGHHERGLRGGTENIAAIAGFAAASLQAVAGLDEKAARIGSLRDRFEARLLEDISGICINSRDARRVHNTSNICFEGVESESVLLHLDLLGICASAGSACTTGEPGPSHVLRAMGLSNMQAQGALRFSLGRSTTAEEVDTVAAALAGIVEKLRSLSSL